MCGWLLPRRLLLRNLLLRELLLGWLLLADSHFADFRQVSQNWWSFWWFSASQNWSYSETPLGETWCLGNFLGYLTMPPALHPGSSDLWRFPSALSSTPNTFDCLLFLIVQTSSFFIHPPFPTQSVRLPLVTYPSLRSTCVTYRTPCALPAVARCFLPNPYLGKQRITLGVARILSMCLCSHT